MLDFAFIHNRRSEDAAYDGRDFEKGSVGGTEAVTMRLAEALAERGHRAAIYNNRLDSVEVRGVEYHPLSKTSLLSPGVIAVSNNSLRSLVQLPTPRRVVWGHLDLRLARLRKRGELFTAFSMRPHLVVPSRYSARRAQAIIPFRSRTLIEHAVEQAFLRFEPLAEPPAPVAVFASQPRRNLDIVLQTWREQIHPRLPTAKLHLYVSRDELHLAAIQGCAGAGIEIKGRVAKDELAEAFRSARVMIYPGHKEETFCNAAAEAIATGLPVVTVGIGALSERVRDGIDGFVAPEPRRMGEFALRILQEDALWQKLHVAGIQISKARRWDARAMEWEAAAARW